MLTVAAFNLPHATGVNFMSWLRTAIPQKSRRLRREDKLSFDLKQSISLNTCCVNEALVLHLGLTCLSISVQGPSDGPEEGQAYTEWLTKARSWQACEPPRRYKLD